LTPTVFQNIATISAGFEKGDFLVREEQGNRVYFDFFEEVRTEVFSLLSSIPQMWLWSRGIDKSHLWPFVACNLFPKAFNYISNKGYSRMNREEEKHWVDLMNVIHESVKGGMKYNTGTLLMVLSRPVTDAQIVTADKVEKPVKKHNTTPAKPDTAKTLNP
jgi:hypothetical protein